ncbi:glyoxylate reductase/hydroxypyruvate reductase-like [Asterias rubens]|uniref:glyoxylate reductase/hydroxypyruvate reductase-like n=1 Tax=Asterias rubens TaxID=7604 RepID=UPI0014558F10|nr:glyoxylate reductase/hydroxypyruvate reductase-like [Asterias rubens]
MRARMNTRLRWKVLMSCRNNMRKPVRELLSKNLCEVEEWNGDEPMPRHELLKRVAGKNGLYCSAANRIDRELLDAAGPSLKVISTFAVGVDPIEPQLLKERSVVLCNSPGASMESCAEMTIALLLATSRRIIEACLFAKSGAPKSWLHLWMCGPGLSGSTVGIISTGCIGQAIGQRLKPFQVRRFLYSGQTPKPGGENLPAEFVSLDDLVKQSDFVVVCCASTPETRGMFNLEAFRKMKKSAIFINTSRGGVMNQDDLVEALQSGMIGAAGLDVTTPEPLPVEHPLLKMNNCVVLPHGMLSAMDMYMMAAQNLVAALEGKPAPSQVTL